MKQGHKNKLVILGLVLLGIALVVLYPLFSKYVTIAWLQERSQALKLWTASHYWLAVFWYMLANIALVLSCIPAIPATALLGGSLFGPVWGAIYATFSSTVGATASYLLFKYAMFDLMHARYGQRLNYLRLKLHEYGPSYLLVMHFMTVIPYCIINMVAVMANISWWVFFWTTIIGSAPLFIIYAAAGRHLSTISSMSDVFTWQSVVMLGILILLALLPMMIKKRQGK